MIQQAAEDALALAGIAAQQLAACHPHGMGNPASDVPELTGLVAALATARDSELVLLGHKTNFGHSVCAAGLVSVLVSTIALQQHVVPAHLNVGETQLEIVRDAKGLLLPVGSHAFLGSVGSTLCTSISGTSVSGDNVHMVLQRHPGNRQQEIHVDQATPLIGGATLCESCEENAANVYCDECSCAFCEQCAEFIHNVKAFRKHVLQAVVQAATTALHKTIRPSNNSTKSSKLSNPQEATTSSTLSSSRSQRSRLDQGYLQQACGFEAQMVTIQQAISSIIKQEMGGAELHPEQPFMASGISSAANSLTDASAISRAITEMVSEIIGVDPPADESVMTLGLGSAGAMELSGRLSKKYGRRLAPTFVFYHPTIYSMVEFFTQGSTSATASSTVPQLVNAEFKDEPRVGYKQWSGSLNRLDKPLYLLGSGGHSRTVIGQLKALDVPIAGIFTNLEKHVGTTLLGVKVLGLLEEVPAPTECFLHICLGQPLLKQEWAARFSTHSYVSIVHPMAGVDESCTMGEGSFIGALALVDGLVSIGAHSIVEGHSVVGHDTSIGSFTLIGGMAAIAGSSVIGDGVVLGTHSSTAPKVRLGNRAVLGSGSSAHCDIPEDCTAVGVPAEVLYEGVAIKM